MLNPAPKKLAAGEQIVQCYMMIIIDTQFDAFKSGCCGNF
uniref:Uncharacterized protein n=1 Tax=mine drainage metagenome TaxID=410659 RepID=E6QDZ3_9ZZZZ